jgi:protein-disulfide isomerase
VDLSGLTATQKASVERLLKQRDCGCGCGMKVAECRVKDPQCSYSKGLAGVIVDAIRSGKSEADALEAAEKSAFARIQGQDGRILSDPVNIPTGGSPLIGPANARIKLVEFSDFQCPFCVLAAPQIHAVLKAYPNDVSLVFKQFPLDFHSQAGTAAAAALAAQKQGKFWEMHDSLFAQRGRLSGPVIRELARQLGLDMKRFDADLNSADIKKNVERDEDDGEKAGVMGTPTLFINGQRFNANLSMDAIKPVLDAELKNPPKAETSAAR